MGEGGRERGDVCGVVGVGRREEGGGESVYERGEICVRWNGCVWSS